MTRLWLECVQIQTSDTTAVHLDNITDFWNIHELIDQSLTIHLGQYSSLIIVSQSSPHGLIVHVRLVLVETPESGHRLAVHNLEHASVSVNPANVFRTTWWSLQQVEQKLPQVGIVIILGSLHLMILMKCFLTVLLRSMNQWTGTRMKIRVDLRRVSRSRLERREGRNRTLTTVRRNMIRMIRLKLFHLIPFLQMGLQVGWINTCKIEQFT